MGCFWGCNGNRRCNCNNNCNNSCNNDPCAEEKRRCYCEGYRDGCRNAPCRWRNEDNCNNDYNC